MICWAQKDLNPLVFRSWMLNAWSLMGFEAEAIVGARPVRSYGLRALLTAAIVIIAS